MHGRLFGRWLKAAAKSEAKYAKALQCGNVFGKLDQCLKDVSSCEDFQSCQAEYDDYDTCTCEAAAADKSYCQ